MQEKDETSRDIGIASLPLRACRPSGGFVLERYRQQRARQTVLASHFHNVDNHVETMCTAPRRFVDHIRHAREPRRGLCGNLLEQWSALLCLAMYDQSQALIQVSRQGRLSRAVQFSSELLATVMASGVGRDIVTRHRCRYPSEEGQERRPDQTREQQSTSAVGCGPRPACRGSAQQPSFAHRDCLPGTRHHRRLDPTAHVEGGRADVRPGHGREGPRPRGAVDRAAGR